MFRALSLTCLIVFALPATASAKPSICILGLEVKDNGNGITAEDTKIASELTGGLRARSKTTGNFQFGGGERDLLELKTMSPCDNEGDQCMADIGKQLGCDYLMFGHIQRDKGAYNVALRLLNVKSAHNEARTSETIPLSEAKNQAKLSGIAARLYTRNTGQSSAGVLIVRANVDRGTVLIDNEPRGTIVDGQATIEGLSASRYRLAVEAEGYKRSKERKIEIEDDKTKTETVELEKIGPTEGNKVVTGVGPEPPRGGDHHPPRSRRGLVIGGAIATGVLAIGFGVSWYELSLTGNQHLPNTSYGGVHYGSNCRTDPTTNQVTNATVVAPATVGLCQAAPTLNATSYITLGGALVAAGFTAWALLSSKHGGSDEHARRGHRKAMPDLVVTPVVTPDGAGATLRFDW